MEDIKCPKCNNIAGFDESEGTVFCLTCEATKNKQATYVTVFFHNGDTWTHICETLEEAIKWRDTYASEMLVGIFKRIKVQ
jgi:hypothetical protein